MTPAVDKVDQSFCTGHRRGEIEAFLVSRTVSSKSSWGRRASEEEVMVTFAFAFAFVWHLVVSTYFLSNFYLALSALLWGFGRESPL